MTAADLAAELGPVPGGYTVRAVRLNGVADDEPMTQLFDNTGEFVAERAGEILTDFQQMILGADVGERPAS